VKKFIVDYNPYCFFSTTLE